MALYDCRRQVVPQLQKFKCRNFFFCVGKFLISTGKGKTRALASLAVEIPIFVIKISEIKNARCALPLEENLIKTVVSLLSNARPKIISCDNVRDYK